MATRTTGKKSAARPAAASRKKTRIEIVDHSHARWPAVLKLITRLGDRRVLLLDEDGWLSARQTVLAGFLEDKPAGYLIFHIYPVGGGRVEARVDARNYASADAARLLTTALSDAALRQCKRLRCVRFKGLKDKTEGRR